MKINIQVGFILIISDLFPECTMISESHGREDLGFPGIFETCGWFTQLIPFLLKKNKSPQQVQKEWDQIPLKGLFFLQHYLNQENRPVFPMIFNYLGNYDQSQEIQMSTIGQGSGSDDQNGMMALVEVNCWVLQKQLHWQIRFHPELNIQESIHSLKTFSKKLTEFCSLENNITDDDEAQLLKLLEDL